MKETGYNRKLDTSGRIMIPSRLRDQMGLISGKEYYFFIHEENGHRYICIDTGEVKEMNLEQAKQFLQQNGIKFVQNDD